MRRKRNSKIILGLLIAVIGLGVGYAAITGVNLLINGSANVIANGDFKVRFVKPESSETAIENPLENAIKISGHNADESAMNVSGMSASIEDDTHASFAVGTLDEIGEYVDFTYTVVNESDEGIDAVLSLEVEDENELSNYFEITKNKEKNRITAGETSTITIRVKLIGQPKVNDVSGTFKVTLTATPTDEPDTITPFYSATVKNVSIGSTINPNEYQNTDEDIAGPYIKYGVNSNNQVEKIEGCKTGTDNAGEVCITAVDSSQYESNKEILTSYFGGDTNNIPSECSEEDNFGTMEFTCANSYVVLAADNAGGIFINDIEHGKSCVFNPAFGIYSCK